MSNEPLRTVDVSAALRLQGWLNEARNAGYVLGGLLLLGALADWRLAFVALAFVIASAGLARARPWAGIVLVLISLGVAAWLERDYRATMGAIDQSSPGPASGEVENPRTIEARKTFARVSRYFACAWAVVSLGCLAGAGVAVQLRRIAPAVPHRLPGLSRARLHLRLLVARLRSRGFPFWAFAWASFAGGLAPWVLAFVSSEGPKWYFVAITLVGVVAGLRLMVHAKRLAAPSVAAARVLDPRAPILLLRSFADDMTPIARSDDQWAWARSIVAPTRWTLEESIERSLGRYGPLVAIGRPGERLPPAGAAREYVANDEWRRRVAEMIRGAHAVVVVLGDTPGLQFEYESLARLGALRKAVIVFPPVTAERLVACWRYFCEGAQFKRLHRLEGRPEPTSILSAFIDADGGPVFVTCKRRDDEDCYRLAIDSCLSSLAGAPGAARIRRHC